MVSNKELRQSLKQNTQENDNINKWCIDRNVSGLVCVLEVSIIDRNVSGLVCVLEVSIFPLHTIFLLYFGNVPIVRYFSFFILLFPFHISNYFIVIFYIISNFSYYQFSDKIHVTFIIHTYIYTHFYIFFIYSIIVIR